MSENEKEQNSKIVVVDQSSEDEKLSETIRSNLEKNVFGDEIVRGDQKLGFHIVNVMAEILKMRNVPATMKKIGCCTCSRCQADVIAMTLSQLPAKYCVVYENDKSPLINFYDQRYNAQISSCIMRSCLMVKEHPRHSETADGAGRNGGPESGS